MAGAVQSALDSAGFGSFQRRALLLCAAGYFATCSELLLMVFLQEPLSKEFGLSASDYAWFPFTISICTFFNSMIMGKVADLYGRSPIFTSSLLLVGGAGLLCALSTSFWGMIVLRCLVSLGNSGLAVVDFIVFQEFAPQAARGRYLYVVFVAGCLGVLYLAAFAAFVPNLGWRWLVVLAAAPTLPLALVRCWFSCETPHYLAATGRFEDAYSVLQKIGQVNGTGHSLPSRQEFLTQVEAEHKHQAEAGTLRAVLRFHTKRLTLPLAAIWLLQSASYWGLTLFLPVYFEAAGIAANRTIFAMVACELPGSLLAAWLVEHPWMGRIGTLRLNYACAALAALALGGLGGPAFSVVPLACMVYFFMIPNWGVLFIFTPESYPAELRGIAMGLFQTLQGIPSITSPFLSASLAQRGNIYMLVWGGCLVLALLCSMVLQSPKGRGPGDELRALRLLRD